jgi:Spy/CpxP family protein refolding chaperone
MAKTWQVVAAFIGIFIAGTFTGGLLALRIARQLTPPRPPGFNQGQGAVDQFAPAQLRNFAEQLNLTTDQREKIRPILQRSGEALRRLRQDTQHETREILERMHDRVAAELTPEQLVKFDEIRERQRQRMMEQMQERKNHPNQPPGGRPKADGDQHPDAMPPPAPAPAPGK